MIDLVWIVRKGDRILAERIFHTTWTQYLPHAMLYSDRDRAERAAASVGGRVIPIEMRELI